MKATNLRVEYMTNPIGIDYVCPRFSWIFEQGTKQTAYQIIAKDDFGNLLWDSGKVVSEQMHLIPWGADDLTSRTRVIWCVTTWDENDIPETSEEAYFEIGQTGLQVIMFRRRKNVTRWIASKNHFALQAIKR